MRHSLYFLAALLLFASCSGQRSGNKNTYQVGEIPDLISFQTFNELDKKMDSVLRPSEYERKMDSVHGRNSFVEGDFKNNRSRMFIQNFSNGKPSVQDSAFDKGVPSPCYCILYKDTLQIKFAVGFFGGMGAEVKISPNHFESSYFIYMGGANPYKYNLSDKQFTNQLILKNKVQSLILNEQPTFKAGQQITGYLTFTTPNWYENSIGNNIDTSYVKGRIYFTCETK